MKGKGKGLMMSAHLTDLIKERKKYIYGFLYKNNCRFARNSEVKGSLCQNVSIYEEDVFV